MRLPKRTLLLTVSGLAIPSLILAAVVSFGVRSTHANPATQPSAIKGMLTAVGTADPSHAATIARQPAARIHAKGSRPLHAAPKSTAQVQSAGNSTSGSDTALDQQNPGALLHGFNGVSSLDSKVTNFGAQFEPPDQGLCVGNGFVLEPVNSAYTIYRANGSVVAGPFNVNDLFHEGGTEFTSDPRCFFDKPTHTWFAVILFISTDSQGNFTDVGRTDLAVNTSGDPTTPWTEYQIDATDNGANHEPAHPGCPCFGDQPRLGIDANNIYISTDEFSILGPEFNGTQIYAVSKSDLLRHASSIHFVHFDNLSIGGAIAGGVQPAITYGAASAEYFLNSLDPNGTGDNRLGVWALTDGDAVGRGDIPTLSSVVIGSEPYGLPPNAVQKDSSILINSDDDRMQQVEFINGQLWGALDTALAIKGDSDVRAAAAWFQVRPGLHGSTLGTASVSAQGYVASKGNYLLYPAIAVTPDGVAGLVMTLSGATHFPSAVYAVLQSGESHFDRIHIAGAGSGSYLSNQPTDTPAGRWGDYSWATFDTTSGNFWFATEYVPPTSSQTPNGVRNWGTFVSEVSANG